MTLSYTVNNTITFTHSNAVHIAAKVATDLKRMQRFYGEPSDKWIQDFEAEIVLLLKYGYMDNVKYGFEKNGSWIKPMLCYTAHDLTEMTDDDPGRITPNSTIDGATFYSLLSYNYTWGLLSWEEQEEFYKQLPFQRGSGPELGIDGYLDKDKTYSAGNRGLERYTLRSY